MAKQLLVDVNLPSKHNRFDERTDNELTCYNKSNTVKYQIHRRLSEDSSLKLKLFFLIGLILVITPIGVSCAPSPQNSLNQALTTATKGYRFSIFSWEVRSIFGEIRQSWDDRNLSANDTQSVVDYFTDRQQNTLSPSQTAMAQKKVETIIALQIRTVLRQNGIINPFDSIFGVSFPPIAFKLAEPPHLLVISPRNQIDRIRDVLLIQNLTTDQMNQIENQVEAAGYSALVVELGGLGVTYPTFVNADESLQSVLNAATEEWVHQYLAFKPLGFRYVLDLLGISRNQDIITMNESMAGIISSEIGQQVYDKYYASYFPVTSSPHSTTSSGPAFNFNATMQITRKNVDSLLANGQIGEAEQYMDEQRDYLQTQGYYIRKLNQAYFAFYGTYADTPAYTDPIGTAIQDIRNQSNSLKDFLNTVDHVTSVSQLDKLANK